MSSNSVTAPNSRWNERNAFFYAISRPWHTIISFEFALAGLLAVGAYKGNPTFAWLFPIDATFLFFLVTALAACVLISRNGLPAASGFPICLYLLFVMWNIATIFWTKERTLEGVNDYILRMLIINGIVFVSALAIIAPSRARIVRFLIASALLALPLALDYIVSGGISHRGALEDRNYLIVGRVISTGFAVFFGFMVFARPLSRQWTVCLICSGASAYALLIVGSRASFLAMSLQTALILFMASYVSKRSIQIQMGMVPALLAVLAALAAAMIAMQSGISAWTLRRMGSLMNFFSGDFQADGSAEKRLEYATAALAFWSDSWWSVFFGDGLFSFSKEFRGVYRPGTTPHNLIVEILSASGVVGLAIFALLLASILVRCAFDMGQRRALASVLVALIAGSLFRTMTSGDEVNTILLLIYVALLSSLRDDKSHGVALTISGSRRPRSIRSLGYPDYP